MGVHAKTTGTSVCFVIALLLFFLPHLITTGQAAPKSKSAPSTSGTKGMEKVVTKKATFVLYVPKGWKASEGSDGPARHVTATDPTGKSVALFSTGTVSQGENPTALAKRANASLGRQAKDLEIRNAFSSRDGRRSSRRDLFILQAGKEEFRSWASQKGSDFTLSRIEARPDSPGEETDSPDGAIQHPSHEGIL